MSPRSRLRLARTAVCLGMFLWTSIAAAQQGSRSWADGLFAESGHNFGAVPRGAIVRHNFVLTNNTAEGMNILDLHASCGCTTATASANFVPSGQTAIIAARMDTRNFVGPKATVLTVRLLSTSGREAEARLAVQSNILADVVLNPGAIDFGTVRRGQTPQLTLTIERIGRPDWRVTRLGAGGRVAKVVDAQIQEIERSASRVAYQLKVALRSDAPVGSFRDELRILSNDPEAANVPVPVSAQVQGDLTATPSLLALGRVDSATSPGVRGRYLIRGGKPFAIRSIEGDGDGFQLTIDDGGKKTMHVLTLTYKPTATATLGDVRRSFVVQTDLPDETPIKLEAAVRVER